VLHDVALEDPDVARIVRRCLDLPGEELFQYVDADGVPHAIASTDVNDYLREAAGTSLSAKDFRTWHASVRAFDLARRELAGDEGTGRSPRGRVQRVLGEVAATLGNTMAVCRKSYVHPCVLELLTDERTFVEPLSVRRCRRLRRVECCFLEFLESSATAG